VKGYTNNFFPNKVFFHLESINGDSHRIEMEDLKAVFFTKDFEGNKAHQYDYSHEIRGAGRKLRVEFNDGEVIVGYSLAYSADRLGFFLTPADVNGNNERVFVLNDASRSVEFV
jgi:hypothetical protein